MTIEYYSKNNYGCNALYVVESDKASAIAVLTGKKTISESDIEALKTFGIYFVEVLPPRK